MQKLKWFIGVRGGGEGRGIGGGGEGRAGRGLQDISYPTSNYANVGDSSSAEGMAGFKRGVSKFRRWWRGCFTI